jgi:hypothetical protein
VSEQDETPQPGRDVTVQAGHAAASGSAPMGPEPETADEEDEG